MTQLDFTPNELDINNGCDIFNKRPWQLSTSQLHDLIMPLMVTANCRSEPNNVPKILTYSLSRQRRILLLLSRCRHKLAEPLLKRVVDLLKPHYIGQPDLLRLLDTIYQTAVDVEPQIIEDKQMIYLDGAEEVHDVPQLLEPLFDDLDAPGHPLLLFQFESNCDDISKKSETLIKKGSEECHISMETLLSDTSLVETLSAESLKHISSHEHQDASVEDACCLLQALLNAHNSDNFTHQKLTVIIQCIFTPALIRERPATKSSSSVSRTCMQTCILLMQQFPDDCINDMILPILQSECPPDHLAAVLKKLTLQCTAQQCNHILRSLLQNYINHDYSNIHSNHSKMLFNLEMSEEWWTVYRHLFMVSAPLAVTETVTLMKQIHAALAPCNNRNKNLDAKLSLGCNAKFCLMLMAAVKCHATVDRDPTVTAAVRTVVEHVQVPSIRKTLQHLIDSQLIN